MRYEIMMSRERVLRSLMWRGEDAKVEKCVKDVMEVARQPPRERTSLLNQVAADVSVVDETMRVKWLVRGRVGERREARHLMYVTRM